MISFTNLLAPTYVPLLTNLSAWLDKAKAELPADEAEILLSARLADDMFPLATQLRFACVQVLEALHRLQDKPFPERVAAIVEQGRAAGDNPGTIADAQVLIAGTKTSSTAAKTLVSNVIEEATGDKAPSDGVVLITGEGAES